MRRGCVRTDGMKKTAKSLQIPLIFFAFEGQPAFVCFEPAVCVFHNRRAGANSFKAENGQLTAKNLARGGQSEG